VKEKGKKAKVGGSTTEKAPVDPLSQAPKPKSASGSQNRRGWIPNPVYVKAKQQRRNLFHDQKYQYQVWLKKKNYLDPRPDSNYDEVLIQCVADVLWNRRLAMILAIPLNHLPSLTIEERVTRWADAVIKNLGVGVCWENFICWCNSTEDLENEPDRERYWAFLAGRVYFYDLTTTVTHRKLSEAGRRQYAYIAQQLLMTLWARLVNLGTGYDIARVRNQPKESVHGGCYEVVPYHFDGIEVVSTNSFKHQATWFPPNEKHHNLAYNSFDVRCCNMDGKPPDYVLKQDLNYKSRRTKSISGWLL